ncbi:hypothetical protein HYT26_02560 [Candidatus Pacearchaeota archaeon]|nr:hypothetical protein [Candidatus Pacearchaeota archaeon]
MVNKKYKIFAMLFASLIVAILSLMYLKPLIAASASLSEEKCSSLQGIKGDNCWHALTHQTLNGKFCENINDNETREHCLEHIPGINKENK